MSVMLGSMLAGTDEAPGEVILTRASGSRSTAAWARSVRCGRGSFSKDRYFQGDVEDVDKLVPEGDRGPRPLQGAARADPLPAGRRAAAGDGLLRRRDDRGDARRAVRAHHGGGAARVASARRDDHEGGAELSALTRGLCPPGRLQRRCGLSVERPWAPSFELGRPNARSVSLTHRSCTRGPTAPGARRRSWRAVLAVDCASRSRHRAARLSEIVPR